MTTKLLSTLFAPLVYISMFSALVMVFLYVPTERQMGLVQRLFYFHVSSASTAFLSFLLVFLASIQFLRTGKLWWDHLALGAAELGVVFSLIVLISGPIWAKSYWGVYWRWEPRLTSMLIMFTIYTAYLMLRSYGANLSQTPRLAAVLGILAFVNIPLVYFSVRLWASEQQLHPQRIALETPMKYTLYVCQGAFLLLFLFMLKHRLTLAHTSNALLALRQQLWASNNP